MLVQIFQNEMKTKKKTEPKTEMIVNERIWQAVVR